MSSWRWVILALLLSQWPLRAEAIDCGHAASKADVTICHSPDLRTMATTLDRLYGVVRAAAHGTRRSALIAGQRTWIGARDRACADPACLVPHLRDRIDEFSALAARVSEANPTLPDLTAVWLTGTWRAGPTTPAGFHTASDLPDVDSVMTFRAGEICVAAHCAPFGLEPQNLAGGPGRDTWPAALGLRPETPFYLTYTDGKATYGLVQAADGTLQALSPGCAPAGTPCGVVQQTWRADGSSAALIRRPTVP